MVDSFKGGAISCWSNAMAKREQGYGYTRTADFQTFGGLPPDEQKLTYGYSRPPAFTTVGGGLPPDPEKWQGGYTRPPSFATLGGGLPPDPEKWKMGYTQPPSFEAMGGGLPPDPQQWHYGYTRTAQLKVESGPETTQPLPQPEASTQVRPRPELSREVVPHLMPTGRMHITLQISKARLRTLYAGRTVFSRAADGRTISFPAEVLKPFEGEDGVLGTFELELDERQRLVRFVKLK